jgi:hypothetical protein
VRYGLDILDITEENFRLPKAVYAAHAVIRCRLTAFIWVQSVVAPCQICAGQSGTGTNISPSASAVSTHHCSILIFTLIQLYQRKKRAWSGNLHTEE